MRAGHSLSVSDLNLRPRSVSEIVDGAFALYRRNSPQYILVTALGHAPLLLMQILVPQGTALAAGATLSSVLLTTLPIFAVSFVTYSLMSGIVVQLGSRYYLGEDADLARTIREIVPRLPALLVASMLKGMLYVAGILAFLVGYLYVVARYFAVSTVIVLEGRGPLAALGRSSVLSRQRKRHILNTLLLVGLIYGFLTLGVSLLASAFTGFAGSRVIQLVVASLFTVVAYPVVALTEMLLYYDVRIRSEGFDLERMVTSLAGAPAPPPVPPAT